MKKRNICIVVCFFTVVFTFAQNMRKFELLTEKTEISNKIYTASGNPPRVVIQEGYNSNVNFHKYSKDGKYLLTQSSDIRIWDVETGLLIRTFSAALFAHYYKIDMHPSGKYVIFPEKTDNNEKYNICIYSVETGELIFKELISISTGTHISLAFSPDENKFFIVTNKKNSKTMGDIIYVYNFKTKKKEFELPTFSFKSASSRLSFSSDSKYLCCGGQIWNLETKNCIYSKEVDYSTHTIINPTGEYIVYVNKMKDNISVIDIYAEKEICNFYSPNNLYTEYLNFTTDGFLVSSYGEKWNIKTGEKLDNSSELELLSNLDSSRIPHSYPYIAMDGKGILFTPDYDIQERNENKSPSFIIKNGIEKFILPYNFLNFLRGNYLYRERIFFPYLHNNNICYYDFYLKQIIPTNAPVETSSINSIIACSNGNVIAYSDQNGKITVYDFEKQKIRLSFNTDIDFGSDFYFSLSPNGEFLILNKSSTYKIINTNTGNSITRENAYIVFSPKDSYCTLDYNMDIYRTDTWTPIGKKGSLFMTFSYDEKYYVTRESSKDRNSLTVALKSIENGKTFKKISTGLPDATDFATDLYLSYDNKYLYARSSSKIDVYDVNKNNLLVSMIADENGDWLTYTPEGYFTGSPGGINKFVHLVDGMQVFELGQLYDTLYRPDLVHAKLEGKDIGENPLKKIVATGDAPRVQFTQAPMATARNVKVEFSVQDTGGGIGYVYLSQNGKAMQVSSGEKSKAGQRFIYTCDVTLAKGENVFEAYAANSANKIESRHVSSTLSWQGKVEDSNLYVLAIGVDKYIKMPQNNLKYSVADATGIIESFKASPGGLYGSVNVMTLLDSDVSKDNIQKAFETFASKVKPDDMFVLHLAGHGVNYGGEYYYLPSDTLAKSDSDYPKVGVSKHFLTESLSEIQSLNTIILLDTCYSGAFIDAKAQGNELAQKTALEHLAHTSGQVILTASANSQTAAEGYKGHGIFTYAIMEAISGKANYNADSTLSIKEITHYVGYEVPNIYEKMGLARQSPWNSPLRGDFSVVATGNRQSPQFHEVSLDGGKRTDWVTVRTDDSDVGNFENALASAKKEAKKTSRSSGADQRSRGKGIYVGLGYGNTRFGSGFDISPEFYFLGWKHFYAGVGSDIIYKGAEKSESGKDIRKLDADIKFLLGYSYTFKRLRPYLCGGVGGYFSGDAKEKEIFVSSNSKTGVVTKTVYESDAKTGFVWEVAVGSDILLAEHFVIGAQYKLKNFVNCGFTDTWTVTIGWPF